MDPSASDMKGGNNNNTNSKPRACMIPQKDVFEFFRCVQTIPVEEFKAIKGGEKAGAASSTKKYLDDDVSVNDTEEDAENGQLTHLKRSDSFMSVVADTDSTSSTSSLSFGSGKRFSFLRRNSTLFGHDTLPSTNDDSPAEVQYAIRGMIAPRDELEQVFVQQNFDAISSLCNNYEMPWKDLIIRPQAGFVVKTQRRLLAKKSFVSIAGTTEGINSTNGPSTAVVTASILYLNICHHAQVGMITKINQQQNGTPNKQIEESIPFILGSWKESTQRVQQHQVIQIATLDIVIPSHYIELVKKDVKQQEIIAMAILQALHTMNIALETNYSFPAIGSQYVFNIDHILSPTSASSSNTNHHNNSDNQFVIPEVFNITEEEKTNYAIAFVGKFYKQGYTACHSYWKERHFLLTESTLQYYALNGSFQYNYHAEEGIQFTYDDDSNEFDSPKGSFPFTIVNNFYQATEQKYLICCVAQEQTRQQLHTIFQLRQAMYLTMKGLICVPTRKCGYLQKLGHWRKNWKSRYFLLDFGELSYYQIKDQFPLLAKWKRHQLAKRQSSTSNNRNSSITQQQKDEENDQSRLTTASTQPSPLLEGNNSNSEVFYSILKKTQQLKGKISLQDAKVNIVWTNDAKTGQLNRNIFRLRITIPNNNKRSKDDDFDLLLQMQSLEELHAWYEVVEEHIHYANQYNN